jgi:AcrR family transcriptional regulator
METPPAMPLSRSLPIVGQPPVSIERSDAARNRRAILDAARRLLKKRPIGEICMDELADTAGVGKGTLYRRFADRAALCHALLDDEARKLQSRALAGFGLSRNALWLHRLNAFLDAYFDFVADNAALLSEASAFAPGPAQYDHPAHDWARQEIVMCLERADRDKEITAIHARPVADMILAALDPDLLLWHFAQGTSRAEIKSAFRRLYQRGIAPIDA